jgi:hypothetical protein
MTERIHGGVPQRRSGWFAMVVAVGVILIVLGVWNVFDGLAALRGGDFVVADGDRVAALSVAAWGWVLLVLGGVEVVAGIALFIGARWARVVAVVVAGVNGVVQLAFLTAYPVGAVLIIVVCVLMIWTIVRHGDAARV